MRKMYLYENVDCPHCSNLMKEAILKIDGVTHCVVNHLAKKIILEFDLKDKDRILSEIVRVCKEIDVDFELIV